MKPYFLRISDVIDLTALSRSSIYRMINDGEFPAQISVGNRQVRWSRKEVLDWCDEKLVTGK